MDELTPLDKAGPFRIGRDRTGRLVALHASMRDPIEVPEAQLSRWLMRLLRESLVIAEPTKAKERA
jgi:hypothetical protein